MVDALDETYKRDRRVWDTCAETYEKEIVEGHPDVTAYEEFEEDLLDRILMYLVRDRGQKVHLYDVGCGSARLHLRYGLKTCREEGLSEEDKTLLKNARSLNPGFQYDPVLATGLAAVGGVDFSAEMIRIARHKMAAAGMADLTDNTLCFQEGSAFDLVPMSSDPLPLAVSVCNSVGVMQGPLGAIELFKSMRRVVESGGGIAVISGYQAEAIETFALGNYESTMNVCGQPRWLEPIGYAAPGYIKVPRYYKRAHDTDPNIIVDVFDCAGNMVEEGYTLHRDPAGVRKTIEDEHIRTHTDYESYWYSFDHFERWIEAHWPKDKAYHLAGKSIDALRGEPAQLAILDINGQLSGILDRWKT